MITKELLEDLGFLKTRKHYDGEAWAKDLPSPVETRILVTFDCYYCRREQIPFFVWLQSGHFLSTEIGIEHIKTEDQLKLLWLALTGEPLPAPKHYLIISRFKGDAIGCTIDRAGVSGEDLELLFQESPKDQCLFCNGVAL